MESVLSNPVVGAFPMVSNLESTDSEFDTMFDLYEGERYLIQDNLQSDLNRLRAWG